MTFSKRAFVLALLVSGTAFAQRSAQDIESARQLYNAGIELRDKGDMRAALEKFKAAHALGNTPITGLELCKAHAALKQPVEAREVCLGVARIPPQAQETGRSQEARNEATKIAEAEKNKISGLKIRITGVPAGYEPTVTVDGAVVPPAALGEPRAVNPGAHQLSARVGSGLETKATVETAEGQTREVEMGVAPPPAGEAPKPVPAGGGPTEPHERPARKEKGTPTGAVVAFAIGGGAAIIGTVAGLTAINKEGDLEKKCTNKACGIEYHDALDSAKTWGNVSTAFFVIAGIGIGTGLVISLASGGGGGKSNAGVKMEPVVGLGGGGIRGSF